MKVAVKTLSILAIFMAGLFHTYAQDVITLKNGAEIKAKVEEISSSEIKYKQFENLDGPTVVVAKSELFFINYENGTREVMTSEEEKSSTPQAVSDGRYAVLHIYRKSAMGALLSYDLHIDDKVICRVSNKWKETIKIDKEGLVTLWAKTEARKELPINIEFGKEYYIRCSVSMGVAIGHPKLELVDEQTGKKELSAIK
jgi:small-conductance mechanosensitive channel